MNSIIFSALFVLAAKSVLAYPAEDSIFMNLERVNNVIPLKILRQDSNLRRLELPAIEIDDGLHSDTDTNDFNDSSVGASDDSTSLRYRRQANDPRFSGNLNIGHSRQSGTDVAAQAQARLWRSDNGRNQVNGNAQYGQHFGGPGGKSRPSYGGGLTFIHRF